MKHWTRKRKASLLVHAGFVTIPFTISTVSAYLFWYARFQTEWLAAPMVIVIDLLALTGLVLYIVEIESPFTWLRHLLPFVSVFPLGWELYGLLIKHNDPLLSSAVTAFVTAVLIVIAWQCFRTIERLCKDVDPTEAERERARRGVQAIGIRLAALRATEDEVAAFIAAYQQPRMLSLAPPQLPAGEPQDDPQAPPQTENLEDLKTIARDMRAAGRPWADVAARVGRSPTTVRGWIEGNGKGGTS